MSLVFIGSMSVFAQENINLFIGNYQNYKMDIQAAGIASIPVADFENDVLTIEYIYFSEGENRRGEMTLSFNTQTRRFEGNWLTTTDNGNVFQGSLYFVFDKNGEATGKYTFANSEYKIMIFKASE